MELRAQLAAKLAEFAPAPEVSVIVTEVHSFKVSVVGAVNKPGRYDTRAWVTVLDALALAGGLTEFAHPSRIVVLRSDGAKSRKIPFDGSTLEGGRAAAVNLSLEPGDIVIVP
jgi:polysaccharide export outer membrane protein